MNTSLLLCASRLMLPALVALGGCVQSGTLEEAASGASSGGASSGGASSGGASDDAEGEAATRTREASTGGDAMDLESSGSSDEGGEFTCADYASPALGCEPPGTLSASIGYSFRAAEAPEDTECTVDSIVPLREQGGFAVGFECPTGTSIVDFLTNSPEFALPFVEEQSVLFTLNTQGSSTAVRSLDGELLIAFVQVEGFEPDIDLGTIEIEAGPSGCPGQPVAPSITSCSAGGAAVNARTPLTITGDGPTGPTVFEGHSAMFDDNGRSFLFLVSYAREAVCWDEDCNAGVEYVNRAGAMAILLVAQSS